MLKTLARTNVLVLLLLAGCGDASSRSASTVTPASTAVAPTSGALQSESLDTDGDGKVETWRTYEVGGYVEATDTDGDGKPDRRRTFETLQSVKDGVGLPALLKANK